VKQQHYSPTQGEVLEPTEARQANSQKTNLRVLVFSTLLISLIFLGFILAFFYASPSPQPPATQGTEAPVTPPAGKPLPAAPGPSNPGNTGQQ
jgi:hypothetical protein